MCKGGGEDGGLVSISLWQNHHLDRNPAYLQGSSTYIHKYTHTSHYMHMCTYLDLNQHVYVRIYIMGDAYVYVQYITAHVHVRTYIFNAPETDSAYIYVQRYTLRFIIYYLILLNLTLADPHTELILARLSYPGQHQHHCQQHHPKSCNLITNHTPPTPPHHHTAFLMKM